MKVLEPQLVHVPAGPFSMGSEDGDENERPEHVVTVDAFSMSACPVTQSEYAAFVQATGWRQPGVWELPAIVRPDRIDEFIRAAAPYSWAGERPPAGRDKHPVVLVTFDDAREYCRWLRVETGRAFRLPTEAEWEKAARGGLERRQYPWGDALDLSMANFSPQSQRRADRGTLPVRAHAPNAFGLYGMAGNVWDWTGDWYRAGYHDVGETPNPAGPSNGTLRVVRGGAWTNSDVAYLRCAYRHPVPPGTYSYSIGFRVVCPGR